MNIPKTRKVVVLNFLEQGSDLLGTIKLDGVEFEVIDGYYFNGGRNDQIKKTIQHLYELRKRLKNCRRFRENFKVERNNMRKTSVNSSSLKVSINRS